MRKYRNLGRISIFSEIIKISADCNWWSYSLFTWLKVRGLSTYLLSRSLQEPHFFGHFLWWGPSNFKCVLWVHLQLGQLPLVPVAADVSQVSGNLCSGWSADLWIKISCCQALVIDIGVVVSWRITWIHYQENSCSTAPQTAEPELGHASVPQGVGLLLTSPHALV